MAAKGRWGATGETGALRLQWGVLMGKFLYIVAGVTFAAGLAAPTAASAAPANSARPFASNGSGTETSLSAPGCQNIGTHDCTVRSAGTATSSHLGTGSFVSDLTVHWASATPNGAGGFCAPADGVGTLTAANGDTVTQTESGTVCEVGATSLNAAHTFTGTFANTGGTGRFRSATGGGTVTGGDDGAGNSFYSDSGTIGY